MDERTTQTERPMRRAQAQVQPQDGPAEETAAPCEAGSPKIEVSRADMDAVRQLIGQLEDLVTNARRMPLSRTLAIIDTAELVDMIGQLRMALPRSLTEAENVLDMRDQLITDAERQAQEALETADRDARDARLKAQNYDKEVRGAADSYYESVRQRTQQEANSLVQDANTQAQQIVMAAHQKASEMIADTEIMRRANNFAEETRNKAMQEADRVFSQACMQTDKMLSGAAAALSRSAGELAQLRDALLAQAQNPGQDNR